MEIKYLENKKIDKQQWNICIQQSIQQLPYAFTWYLDEVCKQWDAIVVGNYDAVFPLPWNKKFGIKYVFPPFFVQQLGLYSKIPVAENILEEVLQLAHSKFRFLEYYLNTFNGFKAHGITKSCVNYELDLSSGYEEIRKGYSENCRRNIRKAQQKNLQIERVAKAIEVINLFREEKGKSIKTLTTSDYVRFEELMDTCDYKGILDVKHVLHEGEICAAACFLKTKGRVIFLFSGNNETGRNTGAMPFLIDSVIQEYSGQKIIFDFEGSNDENLGRFYQSFGAQNHPYLFVKVNRLGFPLKLLKK
ncbi:MAG: GNAT family N-acetyltransferase [Flavobacteriales bacterium]